RLKCQNNLKQIGLAWHSYHDVNQYFPLGGYWIPNTPDDAAWAVNPWVSGKGSWYVFTLPYLEQDNLYKLFAVRQTDPTVSSIALAKAQLPNGAIPKLPYGRCPSDDYDPAFPAASYVASLGPQCAPG